MTEPAAQLILTIAAAYLGVGLLFALGFALRLAGRLDPAARHGTWGFRILIVPGAALLWPLLLVRLATRR